MKKYDTKKAAKALAARIKKVEGVEIPEWMLASTIIEAYFAGMDRMQQISREVEAEMKKVFK